IHDLHEVVVVLVRGVLPDNRDMVIFHSQRLDQAALVVQRITRVDGRQVDDDLHAVICDGADLALGGLPSRDDALVDPAEVGDILGAHVFNASCAAGSARRAHSAYILPEGCRPSSATRAPSLAAWREAGVTST